MPASTSTERSRRPTNQGHASAIPCYGTDVRFAVLGSGSKGNALVVQAGSSTVLVDAGLNPRETKRRLAHLGLELKDLTALVLTHGHGDHVAGAGPLAGALRLITWCTRGTRDFVARRAGLSNPCVFEPGEPFQVGSLQLCGFPVPHDCPGTVGYVIDDGDERLGICTDLGRPDKNVGRALRDCDTLYLEFNHDVEMLRHGPYPAALKRRVEGPYGHLSNEDAAEVLRQARSPHLRKVLLAHLSETNNLPRLARNAAEPVVDGADVEVAIAPQHHPTGWLRVGAPRARPAHRPPLHLLAPRPAPAPSGPRAPDPHRGRRRRPAAVAEVQVAVSRQLTLFGPPS